MRDILVYMNATDLGLKKCVPCEGGVDPFSSEKVREYVGMVEGWKPDSAGKAITKRYSFKDFVHALAFVREIGEVAEAEGHHPDITFGWGYVFVKLTTHAIGGLSENDFIVAYKIDQRHNDRAAV